MKILVIGDVILDLYTRCGCERISPEAPVPVLLPRTSCAKLGGAANVALCCAALGASVECASIVGDDEAASQLAQGLEAAGIRPLFVRAHGRKTSKKERLIAGAQQVARIDSESTEAAANADTTALCALLGGQYDAAIISDYAKGTITRELVAAVRKRARLVLADPKHSLELLRGVDVITPNLKEARQFAAVDGADLASVAAALRGFAARYDIARPAITLSERGIAMLAASGGVVHSAAAASEVYDVTGAGDSVIAALAVALAAGAHEAAALEFANACASVSVSKIGTYAPKISEVVGGEAAKRAIKSAVDLDGADAIYKENARARDGAEELTNGKYLGAGTGKTAETATSPAASDFPGHAEELALSADTAKTGTGKNADSATSPAASDFPGHAEELAGLGASAAPAQSPTTTATGVAETGDNSAAAAPSAPTTSAAPTEPTAPSAPAATTGGAENANSQNPKLMTLEQVVRFAAQHRRAVWTNGCFDILHAGHCSYLAAARALGDCLIVGLNSDESVRALKGPERPINPAADRAAVLAALAAVDAIVIFDAPTPLECIRALRPAVLAKGADYAPEQVIGREFAGELALIEFLPGRSSSQIIKKCKEEK